MADENKVSGLDGPDEGTLIKLVSKDNKEFTIDKKFAYISTLVKTSLDADLNATEVPMPGVKGDVLAKIVEYASHHKGTEPPIIEKPLRSKIMKDVCKDSWDAEFIDKIGDNRPQLYDLILAANYMDIKGLLHLGCAKVASLIKGQPLEKIKDILQGNVAGATGTGSTKDSDVRKDEKKQ